MAKRSFVDSISKKLTRKQPVALVPRESASVAVVFRVMGQNEDVLLIRRAEREEDPWSGQVAFPGGRVSKDDASFVETARRETAEEVGIDLSSRLAVFLGYMHQMKARTRQIVVVPSVFRLETEAKATPSREVASVHWVPLKGLAATESRSTYVFHRGGEEIAFPSIVFGDLVIWGLTERILSAIIESKGERKDAAVLGDVERY